MRFKDFINEMAKRTTPEEFYKMAVKQFGAEKSQSLTMPEVVIVAKNNDVQVPNYVVKNKVGRGRFNLKPDGSTASAKDIPAPTAPSEITEKDCIEIANDFISMLYQTGKNLDIQRPEKVSYSARGNDIIMASVRHWGQWEISQSDRYEHDDEDLEDWDWEVLTADSWKKLKAIEEHLIKKWTAKFNDVSIHVSTEEKNWISIQVIKTS